ncbi:antibiotic biosynthesis monooxygenase [Sphingopyxis sp. XHP0097]|uniref:Antibiotic biosynthesis monooxygenase n=1 Tax=Sphingopyxis jiangsuensis TaxID=2871171 RepID=A0ABS7MH14_9SPHN|nr:antibiotic biosynthesis monooxygenase family protein [Sphingopyxis jiangsuensis]MBY4637984.1 antibiotic biosynthesis monooxygenase [Sphingopyxis jiangsuensis]
MSYSIIWQFTVAPDNCEAFEAGYRPDGPWAALFAQAEGFIETQLLKDAEQPGVYLTIDRWASPQAFDRFKSEHAIPYAALDASFDGLAATERRIGAYHHV